MTAGIQTRRRQNEQYADEHGLGLASWRALGTSAQLLVTDPAAMAAAQVAVEDVLSRIDLAASRFREDSEITAVNTADGAWTTISPLLFRALRIALDAAEWTDGLVDPTVGAAIIDLGYDRTFSQVERDAADAVVVVRDVPGWQQIELDETHLRVRVPRGTIIDLGATAKGLAADLAADAAAAASQCGVLVNLGGDVSVAGEPPRGGWPITVADTADPEAVVGEESEQTVIVRDGGLATSSTRARRWRRGGFELHHLIDPRLGRPSEGRFRTVSVTAATCTLANAASTAAIILDADAPRWLADRGLPARLVARDATVTYVAGWPTPKARST